MRKYSKREKTIIRLMAIVISIALLVEVWESYMELKDDLQNEILSMQSELTTFTDKLKKEKLTVPDYEEKILAVDAEIARSRDRIMELPSESAASLLVRQHISEVGQHVDMNINAINNRNPEEVNEESGLLEMKTYFTYDTELEPLLNFFQIVDQQGYYMVIDQLTLSARRTFQRRRKGRTTVNRPQRNPLSGNMILSTLYMPKAEGVSENYKLVLTGEKRVPRPVDDDEDVDGPETSVDASEAQDAQEPDQDQGDGDDRAMNSQPVESGANSPETGDEVRQTAPAAKPELKKRPRRLTGTPKGL